MSEETCTDPDCQECAKALRLLIEATAEVFAKSIMENPPDYSRKYSEGYKW